MYCWQSQWRTWLAGVNSRLAARLAVLAQVSLSQGQGQVMTRKMLQPTVGQNWFEGALISVMRP